MYDFDKTVHWCNSYLHIISNVSIFSRKFPPASSKSVPFRSLNNYSEFFHYALALPVLELPNIEPCSVYPPGSGFLFWASCLWDRPRSCVWPYLFQFTAESYSMAWISHCWLFLLLLMDSWAASRLELLWRSGCEHSSTNHFMMCVLILLG